MVKKNIPGQEVYPLNMLASSLNRRDEIPNIELAEKIAAKNDSVAVKILIEALGCKSKDTQNDAIKVLYETGERKPGLISGYIETFVELLDSKNNRLQWGAMTALNCIASESPEKIFSNLSRILKSADKGSVITKDNAVNILIKLSGNKKYSAKTLPLLNEQLLKALENQLPMYAEHSEGVITENLKNTFIKTLNSRLKDVSKDSKRKRIEKVIKKLET